MSKKTIEHAKKLVSQMTIDEKISQMLYESPAIERLGIPEYNWWNEALHGVARAGVATVFPQAIGLAATFDTDLARQSPTRRWKCRTAGASAAEAARRSRERPPSGYSSAAPCRSAAPTKPRGNTPVPDSATSPARRQAAARSSELPSSTNARSTRARPPSSG